ncbi:phage baseplate assembly protein [Methylobacterium sp. A49B]
MSRTNLFRFELQETDDRGELQTGKGYGYPGEEFDGHHIVRQHGLASNAPVGSHGIGVAGSGERGLVAILGLEHQDYRPRDQKPGQTTIYDDKGNVSRYLGKDGIWHDAKDAPQKMTGKTVAIEAKENAHVSGKKVYLGGDGKTGSYARVMTESGPSPFVYARIG